MGVERDGGVRGGLEEDEVNLALLGDLQTLWKVWGSLRGLGVQIYVISVIITFFRWSK